MTQLPSANAALCTNTTDTAASPFLSGLLVAFGVQGTCRDIMFSGHCTTMTLWLLLVFLQANPRHASTAWRIISVLFRAVLLGEYILGVLILVGDGYHCAYRARLDRGARPKCVDAAAISDSDDVIIAFLLACLLVSLYYALVELNRFVYETSMGPPDDASARFGTGRATTKFVAWFERFQ